MTKQLASDAASACRKAYSRPVLKVIELTAEEVMGVGCKQLPFTQGAGPSTCSTPACSTTSGS